MPSFEPSLVIGRLRVFTQESQSVELLSQSGLCLGNGNKEDGFEVPVPHALLNTIGYTHKFNVKIQLLALVNEILATGDDASEPAKIPQACADVGLKRMGDGVEKGNSKRSKDGN
ncbi:hypothetical protein YC2023_046277 [Brassica napus]